MGFPPAGEALPLRLEVIAGRSQEAWMRRLGSSVLRTIQWREGDLLVESFGPVRVFFRVSADPSGMRFSSQRARLWGIPMPVRVEAESCGNGSSWEFSVDVKGVGSYRGLATPSTG